MAKYSYPYKCGHGNGEVALYGKSSERERKLAWYADTFVCPDCYKAQKTEEDAKAEKTASVHLAVFDGVYLSVQVHGQLAVNKQALYDLGYRWDDELDGGLLAILKRPKRALQKLAKPDNFGEIPAIVKQWQEDLTALGYSITQYPTVFDQRAAHMWFEHRDKKAAEAQAQQEAAAKAAAEKQDRINKLYPKPTAPVWYSEIKAAKQYWNGKFYGNAKQGWRIYVDNAERKISAEDKAQYERWLKELAEWREFWKD